LRSNETDETIGDWIRAMINIWQQIIFLGIIKQLTESDYELRVPDRESCVMYTIEDANRLAATKENNTRSGGGRNKSRKTNENRCRVDVPDMSDGSSSARSVEKYARARV
jgi:hypothetical protein